MKNEQEGIYIEALENLHDRYAQYYHSMTEYFARRYTEENISYYLNGRKEVDYILPAMEYIKWMEQIPDQSSK